tara:strand:+ start:1529 stop:2608 length:1080 start_codon:yes stop_codon:yes gene_type:complete
MKRLIPFAVLALLSILLPTVSANPVVYKAQGDDKKAKHLVFLASDHEYRSEETLPALARILAKHHGFDCTVLFGVDPETGTIVAGQSNVPGMEALESADGLVIFARFLALPDEQMKYLDAYLNRGGPVVALRTSTHSFRYPEDSTSIFLKYHYTYDGEEYLKGFGHQVQGQTWVGHYGRNHQQSTRITIVPEKKDHPILKGVESIWVQAGAYTAEPADDWEILTMAQPLMSMEQDGEPDATMPPMVGEWTRTYEGANGQMGRCFTSLYGASEDFLNDGYRRMLVNAVYWSLGLDHEIEADSCINFVGPYQPNTFNNQGFAAGIKPSAYDGFKSPIPAHNNIPPRQPKKAKKTPSEAKKK